MEFILTTPDQLRSVVLDAVSKALNQKPEPPIKSDRCNLNDALEITGLSKSKLYKLTSTGSIPCKTFGTRRLVFSRKELAAWMDAQTVDKSNTSSIELALAKSARGKKGGRGNA